MIDLSVTLSVTARIFQTRGCEEIEIGVCVSQQSNLTTNVWEDYLFEASKQDIVSGCGCSGRSNHWTFHQGVYHYYFFHDGSYEASAMNVEGVCDEYLSDTATC